MDQETTTPAEVAETVAKDAAAAAEAAVESVEKTTEDAAAAVKEASADAKTSVEEKAEDIQTSLDEAAKSAEKTFDALAPSAAESGEISSSVGMSKDEKLDVLHKLSVNTVYLMGSSFIVGVLFTVFVLLVLDFMRRNAEDDARSK